MGSGSEPQRTARGHSGLTGKESASGEGRAWGVEDLPLLSRWFVPVTWRVQMRTQHLVLLAGAEQVSHLFAQEAPFLGSAPAHRPAAPLGLKFPRGQTRPSRGCG